VKYDLIKPRLKLLFEFTLCLIYISFIYTVFNDVVVLFVAFALLFVIFTFSDRIGGGGVFEGCKG